MKRLREKIAKIIEEKGVSVDEETESDLMEIVRLEDDGMKKSYPEDSFQMLFWKQQQEASKRSSKGMRWHPLFIKWCIYLRHQSSKAYETLRDSGCISLPSQRTLRDYTNCVKASAGSYRYYVIIIDYLSICRIFSGSRSAVNASCCYREVS